MFASIRNRVVLIVALVALAIFYLFPRPETVREQLADGRMRDTVITRVPLKLGLDLQGGMHLELELDESQQVSSDRKRDTDLAVTVLRKRIDEFGVAEPVIQKVGDQRIVVELAGIRDPERAKEIVQKTASLEFRLTDKTNALENALPGIDRALAKLGIRGDAGATATTPNQVSELLGQGTDSAGAVADSSGTVADSAAADTTKVPAGGPILQALIAPGSAYGLAGTIPGEYAVLETAWVRVDSLLHIPEVERLFPTRNVVWRWAGEPMAVGTEQIRLLYVLENEAILTGDRLESATPQIDPTQNKPVVNFTLDRAGGRRFGAETGRHIGDFMAIVLDNKVQGRAPSINGRIDRSGQITMSGSLQEAQDLALTLNAGALPIPLKVVAERQVGASLGMDSIRSGITALLIGTLLVLIIMISYYRFAGVLAVCALGLYILFTIAGLTAIGATLTLPGLAGLVLSIGIAVDANVLIFERIREELIAGRTVRVAVMEGFQHAMSAIIDSNVSTVLTALFLFQFGTGPVKGFAITLIMGIAASMLTAIFITKTFFLLWLERKDPLATTLSI